MTVHELDVALLIGASILLLAVVAVRFSVRSGLPSLLLYLLLGFVLGNSPAGLSFSDSELAEALGLAALVFILAEGGLTTRIDHIRPVVPVVAALSTVGVLVSVGVTAAGAHLLLGVDWRLALLYGSVVSSTDAAAVFSVLRRLPLRPRLAGILEAESGTNDPMAIILVLAISGPDWHGVSPLSLAGLVGYEIVLGALSGAFFAGLGAAYLRRSALPASGLYPLTVLGFSVLAYAAAAVVGASGFLAVYLAALWLGNADLPHRPATLSFAEGLAWLAQIGLFVMLGMLADPEWLPGAVLPALGVGAVLLLLARPLSVLTSCGPFRLPLREQLFLSWAGLRGAVPIVLAIIPVVNDIPGSQQLFHVVFVLVVLFTLLQAPTLAPLARRLGVVASDEARDLQVEAAPLEDLHADLLQLRVPPRSRLRGVEIGELRLPAGALVTLIVRDGASFVPTPATQLRAGDALLIVATTASRPETERRLRAVGRGGRLAEWFGERGEA